MKPDKYLDEICLTSKWKIYHANHPLLEDYMSLRISNNAQVDSLKEQIKQVKAETRRLQKNRKARIKRRLKWYFDFCAIDKRRERKSRPTYYKEHKNELILEFADHLIFEYERKLK